MDTLTHALTGVGMYGVWTLSAHPGFLHTPVAAGVLVAAVVSSEAPDMDYLVKIAKGPVAYLRQHRGVSHGVPFWFLWPLLISFGITLFVPRHFVLFYLVSLIGVLIHVGLDIFNTYGTQALWPFTNRRFALDTIFVTDLVWILIGFVGLGLVTAGRPASLIVPWFGGAALLYFALRILVSIHLHRSLRRQHALAWQITLVPRPLPWWWSYVAESATHIVAGQVLLSGRIKPQVKWPKSGFDDEVAHYVFMKTELGRAFRNFSRHLIWSLSSDGDTIRVSMADAVYRYNRMFPFSASVTVKRDEQGELELIAESLRGQILDMQALFQDAQDLDDDLRFEFTIPPAKS